MNLQITRRIASSIYFTVGISLVFCLFAGCSKKTVKSFNESAHKYYNEYLGSDIETAEGSLLNYVDTILAYQNDSIKGLDYDLLLASAYARLYLLYQFQEQESKAAHYFEKSLYHFRRLSGWPTNKLTLVEEKRRINEYVEKLDTNKVAWKSQHVN